MGLETQPYIIPTAQQALKSARWTPLAQRCANTVAVRPMWVAMAVEAHDAARSTWHRPRALPFHRKLLSVSSTACSGLRNPNYSKNVHQSLFFLWFQRETAFANFMGHKWTQTYSCKSVVSLHGSWHWAVFVPWRGKIQYQQPCNLSPTFANQLGLTWVMMRFWSTAWTLSESFRDLWFCLVAVEQHSRGILDVTSWWHVFQRGS